MPVIAIALIIAAALGGGTAAVAQNATPGDALWGFKTHVNENVESALAFSAQDKANVDIALAQERLAEAQQLAQSGKLNANAQAELSANFSAHAQDVAAQIAKLQAAGQFQAAAEIAAKFQSTLAGESSTIASANANAHADVEASLAPLLSTVHAELNKAASMSSNASAEAATHANAQSAVAVTSTSSSQTSTTTSRLRVRTDGDAHASTSDSGTGASLNVGSSVKVINY